MTMELLSGYKGPQGERMKVLFATMPLDEHVLPMTSLAAALRAEGHDVRWYTGERHVQRLSDLGIPHLGFRRPPHFHSANLNEVFPKRPRMRSEQAVMKHDLREMYIRRGPEYYEDLREIHQEFPFTVMVADLGFTGIPYVSRLMKIPVIAVGLHPLKESSVCVPPYGSGKLPSATRLGRIRMALQRLLHTELSHRSLIQLQQRTHAGYGIRSSGHVHDDQISHSTIVLQSGVPGFEYGRHDMSDHIRFCGPVFAHQAAGEKFWMGHHGTYEHTILVAQHPQETDHQDLLIPVLETYQHSNARVIALTGGHGTEALRQKYASSNVIIEDDVELDDVMPYCDVFVGRGCHQDVMKSIRHELPMVVAGWQGCRKEVGARVAHFKLGVHLRQEQPSGEQLKRAIDEVLSNPAYRHKTREIGTEFARYDAAAMLSRYVQMLAKGFVPIGGGLRTRPMDIGEI